MRSWAAVLAVSLFLGAGLAGCASKAQQGGSEQPAAVQGDAPVADPTAQSLPTPTPMSQRWHFHDYWHGSPTITLLDQDVNFSPMTDANGMPELGVVVSLPQGVIVPAETGFLTVNATWNDTTGAGGGAVNLTYRPSDSQGYFGAGNLTKGKPLVIFTTESMCDVPHRQQSFWRFNFTAVPNGTPPTLPPPTVHVKVTATIGRPLFIDPPHIDWWQGADTLPLVKGAKGDIATATTRAGNVTLAGVGANAGTSGTPSPAAQDVVVPVDAGDIVPEGAVSIVAVLNWTSQAPQQKLTLHYQEGNYPSAGAMSVAKDADGSRVFVLSVQPAQTDTTYSNRTTWEFHVLPEGGTGTEAAFQGSFTLVAWVTKLAPQDAVRAATGGK
jgi:hypothetical protein